MNERVHVRCWPVCWLGLVGVSGLALVVAAPGRETLSVQRLHAAVEASNDLDGDGLPNALELKLGTASDLADTDGDGFSDAEELARGSIPTRKQSLPPARGVAMDIEGYSVDGSTRALTTAYFADGDLRENVLGIGVLINGVVQAKSLGDFRLGQPIAVIPGKRPGSRIVIVDPVIPTDLVYAFGSMSYFATLASSGSYVAADALNLILVDGEVFEHAPPPFVGTAVPEVATGGSTGGVYKPLSSSSSQPNHVIEGEICAQTTMVLGIVGAVVTHEVIEAACVPGWDAYCSRGCANTVGSTLKVIDPATLIGG